METAEIQKMSHLERLRTMECLWDALCHENDEPESPEWHGEVLEERRRNIAGGGSAWLSLDEAKQRLRQ